MPLEEFMHGNKMQLFGSNGQPFSEPVLKAAGMDVSVTAPAPDNKPALSSDISSLVLTNKGPSPSMG